MRHQSNFHQFFLDLILIKFLIRDEAILAYLSTNFKIKEMQLLLKDNSLRNKLIRFAAQEQGVSEKEFKNTIINQIDSFSMSTQKTKVI